MNIEDGTGHVKSIHIIMECMGMIIVRILFYNDSSLNVCPLILSTIWVLIDPV